MSLLFIDGFDHYATADIGLKWSGIIGGANATINATGGRRGGGALSLTAGARVWKDLAGSATMLAGAAYKTNGFGAYGGNDFNGLLYFSGAVAPHVWIGCLSDGALAVYRRSGSGTTDVLLGQTTGNAVPLNVSFYLEAKATIDAAAGSVRVLVNGVSVLNLTGINTFNSANSGATTTRVQVGSPFVFGGSSITTVIDDLYIADNGGTVNNDFFGDCRVDMVLPSSDGTYHDFTPDSGTVHYSRVNEAVADAATNVASSVVGAKDSFHFAALSGIVGVVRGVQIVDAALKDDAGTRSISHLAKQGVSEAYTSAIPLSTDRKLYTTIHETDPATGVGWTQAGVNSAEFGVVVAA